MGKLMYVSPTKIIANKEGMPRRFTSTLEDLSVVIITLKQDEKFTGTSLLLPKGLINELFHNGIIQEKRAFKLY